MVLFVLLQELLPLVLMFELPVIVQLNPDPSSPAIQHISQTYNISVAFKQRSRLYGATGVVRGSQNNAAAVKVRRSYTGASSPSLFACFSFLELLSNCYYNLTRINFYQVP